MNRILTLSLACALVAAAVPDVGAVGAFGPGKISSFTVPGVGSGLLVGVSDISWSDFSSTDYYGVTTFASSEIVDAEKTAANDDDDYWCYQISDMNALYLTGWATRTSYATVDDMKESFSAATLRGGSGEGTYGFVKNDTWGDFFDWYNGKTGVNLASSGALTEGTVGSSFLSTVKGVVSGGGVLRLNVYFSNVVRNPRWSNCRISHGVLCVGYVADGGTLKALFIIDPDNDQYTGSGGRAAPNSIMYCPVSWVASAQAYTISGVWGQDGEILPEYRALSVMPDNVAVASKNYKVKFNAAGGKGKMKAQSFAYGMAKKLSKNKFKRAGWVFLGWATSKADAKKGIVAYVNAQTVSNLCADGGTVTLYAAWAKKSYKVKFNAVGGKGKMSVQSFTYGKAKKLAKNKFKKKGYSFAGWARSKAAAKQGLVDYRNRQKVKNLVKNGKAVKLYAVWTSKKASSTVASSAPSGGTASPSSSVTPSSQGSALSPPTNVSATTDKENGITLSWTPVSLDGVWYMIARSRTSNMKDAEDPFYISMWTDEGASSFFDYTATAGVTYYYWICSAGKTISDYSDWIGPFVGRRKVSAGIDLAFTQPEGWGGMAFVTSTSSSRVPETTFTAGSTIFLNFAYFNSGLTDAGSHEVHVELYDDVLNTLAEEKFPVSSCMTSQFMMLEGYAVGTFGVPGKYSLSIFLDSGSQIAESNEYNNLASIHFTVK